mgnify:CR=1 FL=1
MAKRQYNQLCPLAYALDIIGERWTLLIVRELIFGPRRYTDLLNGLRGVGTNLLANRLKALEDANVIRQRQLPPPAASSVYELSEHGKGLIPIVQAMALWGMAYIPMPPPDEHYIGTVTTMNALTMLFNEQKASTISASCEFHGEDEIFHVQVQEGNLNVIPGIANNPDVVMEVDYRSLVMVINGMMPRQMAQENGALVIKKGSEETLDNFISAFGFA